MFPFGVGIESTRWIFAVSRSRHREPKLQIAANMRAIIETDNPVLFRALKEQNNVSGRQTVPFFGAIEDEHGEPTQSASLLPTPRSVGRCFKLFDLGAG
jgi:hypothetical protein